MFKLNKQKLKSMESYDKIVEASYKVFAKYGFEKASIDLMAKEAGYTKGTFYLHFTSKEEFFLKLMDDKLLMYKNRFLPLLHSNEPIETVVKKGIDLFFQLTAADDWIPNFFEFCANAIRNDILKERMSNYYQEWVGLISSVLQNNTQFPKHVDVQEIAALIIALLDGYNLQKSFVDSNINQENMERSILAIIRMYV